MKMHERRRILARAVVAAAVLALAAAAGCQAQQIDPPAADAWIGATWPPPPERVEIARTATLGTGDTASFALAEVRAAGAHLLWLGHRQGEVPAGAAWTVSDVLPLPVLDPDRRLMLAVCGAPAGSDSVAVDPELVAYATPADSPVLRVRGAYRADRATGRFQVIPYGGIVCRNDARAD